MGNGKPTDKVTDEAPTKPEQGSETEKQLAQDSQESAAAVVKQERLEKLSKFLEGGTMSGLAGVKGSEKFEITGDLGQTTRDSSPKVAARLDENREKYGEGVVQEVAEKPSAGAQDGQSDAKTYKSPSGREYRETDKGLEYTVKDGDNPWNIVKDSLKAQGNPDPSNAEVAAELKRIEKATGRDMDSTIYAGDTFVIPPKEAGAETEKPADSPDAPEKPTEAPDRAPNRVPLEEAQGETDTDPNTVVETDDGPVMTKDVDGNIRKLDYNDQGELDEIEDEDGSRLVRQQDEDGEMRWHRYDAEGNPVMENGSPVTYDDVQVDENGALTTRRTGSETVETEYLNNTKVSSTGNETTITEADGTVKEYTTDEYGRVIETSTPKGRTEYDPETGEYKFYDPDNKPIENPDRIERIEIDDKGTVVVTYEDATTATKRPDSPTKIDKSRETSSEDGPAVVPIEEAQGETDTPPYTIVKGEHGALLAKDKDGNIRQFEYDEDGNLDEVIDEDGTRLVKKPDEEGNVKWYRYEEDGTTPVLDADGKPVTYDTVEVDRDGTLYLENAQESTYETMDGRTETEYKNDPEVSSESTVTEGGKTTRTIEHKDGSTEVIDASDSSKGVAPEVPVIAPYIPALFSKDGDAYNPVNPPGFNANELDWSEQEEVSDYDGQVTKRATGELEDSTATGWGDTGFTASETTDESGRVVHRKIEYDGGKDITFQGPDGPVTIEDVTSITTRYNPETGTYTTGITTSSGEVYTAETATTGAVKSLALIVPASD